MADPQPPYATTDSLKRTSSMSQASETSQTAQDYITSQLRLEADAREALPYQFDACTKPLGPLRQSVFACLTCTPPPATKHQQFTAAGVCYSCSISCHGEHNLVELFTKRDFVCDCGTTRLGNSGTPCSLRLNAETGRKGGVVGEEARQGNRYNQNYQGKFCGCGDEYDPEKEKGTMFQCLGLGTVDDGGCGEDWWHPECLMGLPRQHNGTTLKKEESEGALETVKEEAEREGEQTAADQEAGQHNDEDPPLPPGFPDEETFDHLICYKCVDAFPWVKQYAGTPGFLPAVYARPKLDTATTVDSKEPATLQPSAAADSKKRKAVEEAEGAEEGLKKAKASEGVMDGEQPSDKAESNNEHDLNGASANGNSPPKHASLPAAPESSVSLFLKGDFRDHLCRCSECFPRVAKHKQLLEEEDSYEPPMSESDAAEDGNGSIAGRSMHSGSLLERGEAALSSMDRVRAIEGVMAYNHVKDKVKAFLQPFAESGEAVSAEDIKSYFAKLRGDESATRQGAVGADREGGEEDHRREQGGY